MILSAWSEVYSLDVQVPVVKDNAFQLLIFSSRKALATKFRLIFKSKFCFVPVEQDDLKKTLAIFELSSLFSLFPQDSHHSSHFCLHRK